MMGLVGDISSAVSPVVVISAEPPIRSDVIASEIQTKQFSQALK
jgi:hypothetical protein